MKAASQTVRIIQYYIIIISIFNAVTFGVSQKVPVHGRVTGCGDGGKPIGDIRVIIKDSANNEKVFEAITDLDGGYNFQADPGRTYTVKYVMVTSYEEKEFVERTNQVNNWVHCLVPREGRLAPPIKPPCEPIFFPFKSANINKANPCLDKIAWHLQTGLTDVLVIDGHRDQLERPGISITRANNAYDYFVNEKGIDKQRITLRNFGDTCPHESRDQKLNRRVEFWILPQGTDMSAIDDVKKCSAGANPRIISGEQPAKLISPKRKRASSISKKHKDN